MSNIILVTGANSFVGGWIIKYLLDKDYYVRGIVRLKTKESRVLDGIPTNQHNRISFVHINDITSDTLDDAVMDTVGIIHVASPVLLTVTDPEKDFLLPAIHGTLNVLRTAHTYNKTHGNEIKRIVITSSFAAVNDASKGSRADYTYTVNDWCPLTYEDGLAAKDDYLTAYRASKTCAERAVWEFVEREKPSFTVTTICAPMILGPRINGLHSFDEINSSNSFLWTLTNSGKDAAISDRKLRFEVDVRDAAYAHVAALERCTDTNNRYLIATETWSHQSVVDIVHQSSIIPNHIKSTTPIGEQDEQLSPIYHIDTSKAQNDLAIKYIPLRKTIEDLMLQFSELKKGSIHQLITKTE